MLDFYRLADTQRGLKKTEENCYLGSLSLEEHRLLDTVFLYPQGVVLPYFEDSRLSSHQVKLLLEACVTVLALHDAMNKTNNTIGRKFIEILEQAIAKGEGLIAICD